ncbi:hypothetical protein LWC35_38215 [Pseudonocardia kujensis]|uniref:hypothetical protein n=1 Tax=Pseudonocardia kujensis TaxID=1128675 RepID=UPI001E59D426|nr:hypothetical protein [Pseudonocardia kujensis]MCE0768689.1 hypothetical protein [Pseudonocardia kujensis]
MTTQRSPRRRSPPALSAAEASRALERYRLNHYPGEWGYRRRAPSPGHDVLG